jgi:nucleoside-diphosphate-sugar epimerase
MTVPDKRLTPPSVLITGAAGFLGSELVRQSVAAGMNVRMLDLKRPRGLPALSFHAVDLRDTGALENCFHGMEAVIHAAGLAHQFRSADVSADAFRTINEIGTANAVRSAVLGGVRRFLLVSSVAVYGSSPPECDETQECRPVGPYAISKLNAEQRAIDIAEAARMQLTILRLATVYGEEDPGNLARLIRAIEKGRFVWIGTGSNRKSLIHRDDAARACIVGLQRGEPETEIYNVTAPACAMRDIVQVIAEALGKKIPKGRIPSGTALFLTGALSRLSRGRAPFSSWRDTIQKWVNDDVYSCAKFAEAFGFQANVGFVDGLRREVEWYKNLKVSSKR